MEQFKTLLLGLKPDIKVEINGWETTSGLRKHYPGLETFIHLEKSMLKEKFKTLLSKVKQLMSCSALPKKNDDVATPPRTIIDDLLDRYVPPHKKTSRTVTNDDIETVIREGGVLLALCSIRRGMFPSAYAVAHPQIEKRKPLRFFVTRDGEIIINPIITNHSNYTVESIEGCMTFPTHRLIPVKRFQKCEVDYQTIEDNKLTEIKHRSLSGKEAFIYQHEIQHFDGQNIFNIYE